MPPKTSVVTATIPQKEFIFASERMLPGGIDYMYGGEPASMESGYANLGLRLLLWAAQDAEQTRKPLYQFSDAGRHYYATSSTAPYGYTLDGPIGFVSSTQELDTTELYEYSKPPSYAYGTDSGTVAPGYVTKQLGVFVPKIHAVSIGYDGTTVTTVSDQFPDGSLVIQASYGNAIRFFVADPESYSMALLTINRVTQLEVGGQHVKVLLPYDGQFAITSSNLAEYIVLDNNTNVTTDETYEYCVSIRAGNTIVSHDPKVINRASGN